MHELRACAHCPRGGKYPLYLSLSGQFQTNLHWRRGALSILRIFTEGLVRLISLLFSHGYFLETHRTGEPGLKSNQLLLERLDELLVLFGQRKKLLGDHESGYD